jgi:hypothetical protein
MPSNNNPDLLYNKNRTDLLRYEDARFNSLIQAVADFYSTRNDQSIWGNFLRALAIELARLDYDYSYDLVNKDPSLLTPPDIRRRWASPLYVSANWPAPGQFDYQYKQMLVELIAAYRMGTTVEAIQDVIEAYTGISIQVVELYKLIGNGIYDESDRNAISVSVQVGGAGSNPLTTITSLAQLQTIVSSLYNAIALAKPAHVGLEFTTIFGEGETLDCILSAQTLTEEQFNDLSPAQQSIYQFTGYTQVNPALFWKASTAFPLGNLLRDQNGNFQIVTSIGSVPNDSGLTVPSWSTVSGNPTTDNELTWDNISPSVTSTAVTQNILTVDLSFAVPLNIGAVVTLINLGVSTFLNKVPLTVTDVSGASFTAAFGHADYATTAETTGTATFALPANITTVQFDQLNATWQDLYQNQYTNYCCGPSATNPSVTSCDSVPQGITDTLRIFIKQVEAAPFGPMLIQAPVLNPANPKTTIAAYGRLLSPSLQPAVWAALPAIFVNIVNGMSDGTNATYSYVPTTQFLHENEQITITGFSNAALNLTAPIKNVFNLVANINGTSIAADVLTVSAPNLFVPGMLVTLQGTAETFLNGQSLVILTASPDSFTASFTGSNYVNDGDSGTAEVSTFQIPSTAVVSLEAPSVIADAGLLTPTIQSAYYLSNGMYVLGLPPIGTSVTPPPGQPYSGTNWIPSGTVFQGQIIVDTNGNTQLAVKAGISGVSLPMWATAQQDITTDGTVQWRNVGRNTYSVPNTWVQLLNMETNNPTGEVGNWDTLHQYGLVAPRLDQVWEVSGGDQDFIFGLY